MVVVVFLIVLLTVFLVGVFMAVPRANIFGKIIKLHVR